MADYKASDVLRHSVLDRLARGGRGASQDIRIGFADLLQAVRRDIEWLLNSSRVLTLDLEDYPEARRSILNYGLPDFSTYSEASLADRQQICRLIAETLRRFEPRLAPNSIRVEHVADRTGDVSHTRFRIQGLLHVDPVKEVVVFDTKIELETGAVEIEAEE